MPSAIRSHGCGGIEQDAFEDIALAHGERGKARELEQLQEHERARYDDTRPLRLKPHHLLTLDTFGASGPYKVLAEHFGFTAENVLAKARELL